MAAEFSAAQATEWNIAFLVKDYPSELHVQGPGFFMAKIDEGFMAAFRDFAKKKHSSSEMFVGSLPADQFTWVGVRICGEADAALIAAARHRVDGFIDGIVPTLTSTQVPRVCDAVWVSRPGEPDMRVLEYHFDDWMESAHSGPQGRAAWNERNEQLRSRVILFFELAAETHSKSHSEVGVQLRHSLRMFRYGLQSHCFGVEFICKFSALEGLVCGRETQKKQKLLTGRLSGLFPGESSEVAADVKKLWEYRCHAVHTGQAFDSGSMDQGAELGVHLIPLNRLFLAAAVFTLDCLPHVSSVGELWSKVTSYKLPAYASMTRPQGMEQYALKNMAMPLGATAQRLGAAFDDTIANARQRVIARQAAK